MGDSIIKEKYNSRDKPEAGNGISLTPITDEGERSWPASPIFF